MEKDTNAAVRAGWNGEWDTMTALPAVSAIPAIWNARSGILGLKDAGLLCAPAGLWLRGGP